jgi:adenylate kinase
MGNKNIIIFGAPGSGKGTISSLLEEKMHIIHLSTGDILRREVDIETDLGLSIKEYTESGKLVPDEIVTNVIIGVLKNKQHFIKTNGFVLDGFPRNLNQARLLSGALKDLKLDINSIIYLYVKDKKTLVNRLISRLICKNCEKNYNKILSPSKIDNICDICGGELYRRVDDIEDVVYDRIDVYEKNFVTLIKFFERENIDIKRIDSNRDKDIIVFEIIEYLSTDFSKQ